MKTALKILLGLLGVIVLVALGGAGYIQFRGIPTYEPVKVDLQVEVTPERVAQGARIASMVCIQCHAGPDNRLTGKRLLDIPKMFGTVYSMNITQDTTYGIGKYSDGEIFSFLRTGIRPNGEFAAIMPKFPNMADEDVYSIIAWLRSDEFGVQPAQTEAPASEFSLFSKFLANTVIKPLPFREAPIPLPDTTDAVAHGKYLANGIYTCYACHSGDLTKLDHLEPEKSFGFYAGGTEMVDLEGNPRLTANLTPDPETGIGAYTEEEFVQAVKHGVRPNGKLVRYPMVPHSTLTDPETRAIFAYLRTLPPVVNEKGNID